MGFSMDPNEALHVLREWVDIALLEDRSETETDAAERFEALDIWLTKGGFLPKAWQWTTDDRRMQ